MLFRVAVLGAMIISLAAPSVSASPSFPPVMRVSVDGVTATGRVAIPGDTRGAVGKITLSITNRDGITKNFDVDGAPNAAKWLIALPSNLPKPEPPIFIVVTGGCPMRCYYQADFYKAAERPGERGAVYELWYPEPTVYLPQPGRYNPLIIDKVIAIPGTPAGVTSLAPDEYLVRTRYCPSVGIFKSGVYQLDYPTPDGHVFEQAGSPGRRPIAGDTIYLDHSKSGVTFSFGPRLITCPDPGE